MVVGQIVEGRDLGFVGANASWPHVVHCEVSDRQSASFDPDLTAWDRQHHLHDPIGTITHMSYCLASTSQLFGMSHQANRPHDDEPPLQSSLLEHFQGWKLEDAKAQFSEVVGLAREAEPQRITVRGQDAVVILSARDFAKLLPLIEQPNLHVLLS